jgi:hypothetical protein
MVGSEATAARRETTSVPDVSHDGTDSLPRVVEIARKRDATGSASGDTTPAVRAPGHPDLVVAAAFVLAALEHFGDAPDLADIRDFVVDVKRRNDPGNEIPQLVAEGLIRSVLGERHLRHELPHDLIVPLQTLLASAMLATSTPARDGKDFAHEAFGIAERWLAERPH